MFSKQTLKKAFDHYRRAKDECSKTGDWRPFAQLFTEDANYIEHAYGQFKGRREIEKYIVDVMAPFPNMTFKETWITYDDEHNAIIWELYNVFPPPNNPVSGEPFSFPNVSRLVLSSIDDKGVPLFKEEQDYYNPAGKSFFHAGPTTKAWRKAGGKFLTREKLFMTHGSSSDDSRSSKL